MDNQGKLSEKKKKQADSRLGKLLEKIRGKEEPISNAVKKEKRVHIKWKRRDRIKQMDITVSLKNREGHRFLLRSEEDTIAAIKQKAIELYFPNGKNKYGEEGQNCTINIQDASGVLVNEDKLLSTFLKERGVYTSKLYFVLHSYFEIFNSDLLEHDVCSICYCQMIAGKCAFCFPSVLETARSAGSYSSATMVNSQQSNQKLSLDYDHGDLECFLLEIQQVARKKA